MGSRIGRVAASVDAPAPANRNPVTVKQWLQAAMDGDIKTLQTAFGTDINDIDAAGSVGDVPFVVNRRSALVFAAEQNRVDVLRWLLKTGADPNFQDRRGLTAFMCACACGHESVVRELLPVTDIDQTDNEENGPLTLPSSSGHAGIVRLLLANGVDANATNRQGRTALDWAVAGFQAEVVSVLLEYGTMMLHTYHFRGHHDKVALETCAGAIITDETLRQVKTYWKKGVVEVMIPRLPRTAMRRREHALWRHCGCNFRKAAYLECQGTAKSLSLA